MNVQNNPGTEQRPAEAHVVDAPQQLPVDVPIEVARVTPPKTTEFPVPDEVSAIVSSPLSGDVPRERADSSTEHQQATQVYVRCMGFVKMMSYSNI